MTSWKQKIGRWGENIAAKYLEDNGYIILYRNVFTRVGEIDIVAQIDEDGESFLVFVEVKTRTTLEYGNPEDAVSEKKKEHLLRAIDLFFQENDNLDLPWQIDVIAIQKLSNDKPPDLKHFENVFS